MRALPGSHEASTSAAHKIDEMKNEVLMALVYEKGDAEARGGRFAIYDLRIAICEVRLFVSNARSGATPLVERAGGIWYNSAVTMMAKHNRERRQYE